MWWTEHHIPVNTTSLLSLFSFSFSTFISTFIFLHCLHPSCQVLQTESFYCFEDVLTAEMSEKFFAFPRGEKLRHRKDEEISFFFSSPQSVLLSAVCLWSKKCHILCYAAKVFVVRRTFNKDSHM